MNTKNKKTIFVLIGILAISLVAGNALFAANDSFTGRGPGLVSAEDVAWVSAGYSANESSQRHNARNSESSSQRGTLFVADAEDAEFLSKPFAANTGGTYAASEKSRETSVGLVSSGDFGFVNGRDSAGSILVCMVDGVQVSGKQCIN